VGSREEIQLGAQPVKRFEVAALTTNSRPLSDIQEHIVDRT
jgi:hypothetical protein